MGERSCARIDRSVNDAMFGAGKRKMQTAKEEGRISKLCKVVAC